MLAIRTAATTAGLWTCFLVRSATAQIDYRNLDDERPVTTEDAYPVERHAFELLAPYRYEREKDRTNLHLFPLELEYGALDNTQVGIKAPIAGVGAGGADTEWGLAGLGVFGLYNFNTESPSIPALSLRADVSLPVGSLAGDATRLAVKAIATRSWGRSRVHFNAVRSFGSGDAPGAADVLPRWSYGLAVDRTLFRQSALLVADLTVMRTVRDSPTEVNAAGGVRYQLSPTIVLDAGVGRRLRAASGPDIAVTFGLSHAFGFAWLMPGRP